MNIKAILPVIIVAFSCTPSVKEGTHTVVSNDTVQVIAQVPASVEKVKEDYCDPVDLSGFSEKSVYGDYAKYLNTLDCYDPESITKAGDEYIRIVSGADTARADSVFMLFNNYYDIVTYAVGVHVVSNEKDFIPFVLGKGRDSGVKPTAAAIAYNESMEKNGLRLAYPGKTIDIRQVRDFLEKRFYQYLSSGMRYYLKEVNIESNGEIAIDAGRTIGVEEIVRRTLAWEMFLRTYPSSPYRDEVEEKLKEYLGFLLAGKNNTIILEYEDKKPSEYFM